MSIAEAIIWCSVIWAVTSIIAVSGICATIKYVARVKKGLHVND